MKRVITARQDGLVPHESPLLTSNSFPQGMNYAFVSQHKKRDSEDVKAESLEDLQKQVYSRDSVGYVNVCVDSD